MTGHQIDYNRTNYSQEQYTAVSDTKQGKPVFMRKRVGSTTYRVRVHFSSTSSETVNDKITRLIRRDVAAGK